MKFSIVCAKGKGQEIGLCTDLLIGSCLIFFYIFLKGSPVELTLLWFWFINEHSASHANVDSAGLWLWALVGSCVDSSS